MSALDIENRFPLTLQVPHSPASASRELFWHYQDVLNRRCMKLGFSVNSRRHERLHSDIQHPEISGNYTEYLDIRQKRITGFDD